MLYEKITKREPINKGWSGDKKYRVTCEGGDVYLLRVSPAERYENRKRLFDFQFLSVSYMFFLSEYACSPASKLFKVIS